MFHLSYLNLGVQGSALFRDSVRKAREAYLIERSEEPLGLNKKDET